MKRIYTLIFLFLLVQYGVSQNKALDTRKFIEVTGSAEINVQPEEIELNITLMEYEKTKNKTSIEKIEKEFLEVLKKNKISKKQISITNQSYYWYYWWSYRNHALQRKQYSVTIDKSTDLLKLMNDLNFQGVQSLQISNSTSSKLQELRKEVKIQAVKASKEKAAYLLESIGEELGGVLSIEEIPENKRIYWGAQPMLSNVVVNSPGSESAIGNVADIKLRYEIKAKFEIK